MSRDRAYLADIVLAGNAIRRFLIGVSFEAFEANEEKYEAVSRKFEIIGEAARRISPETRKELSDIPWKQITAMRNFLIHDYDEDDLSIVWRTAELDIPPLLIRLEGYLRSLPPGSDE